MSCLQAAHGDRDDVPNYAILITDGESTVNKERTLPEAVETRIAGVILTVVVVGHRTASLEVKGIASDPDDRHVMSVESFEGLRTIIEKSIGNTCDGECRDSVCGVGRDSVCGVGRGSICGVGRDSVCGVGRDSVCGVGRDSVCGVGRDSVCGVGRDSVGGVG